MTDPRVFLIPFLRMAAVNTILAAAMVLPAGAQGRLAESWIAMIEACVSYAETGRRAVFDGWDVAFDGGGVCSGDPGCEDADMIFVAAGGPHAGAVAVRVGAADWVGQKYFGHDPAETVVGSYPAHAFCSSAPGTLHRTADVDPAHADWLTQARDTGRLVPAEDFVSAAAGPYLGCGFGGRAFLIEFSLARPGPAILRLNYPTRALARGDLACAGAVS